MEAHFIFCQILIDDMQPPILSPYYVQRLKATILLLLIGFSALLSKVQK